ncbi:MAG: hypothetical protein JNM34_12860, partial [Chthonomonadaceae bacterium]|nr:hypothetical protein [Chthonomonadaceae bacterium]
MVGLLIVDQDCHVLLSSGLAIHHDWGTCHQLKGLVESTLLGKTVTALIRSMRVYTGLVEHMGQICIGLLIVDASHEMEAMRRATASDKRAETLKRIGKALTMHQTLVPLSVAAVHAISSAIETSAVLLWIQTTEDGPLELAASVGASRAGITTLSAIDPKNGVTCAAELVAMRRRPLILNDLNENPLTQALEAQFCY